MSLTPNESMELNINESDFQNSPFINTGENLSLDKNAASNPVLSEKRDLQIKKRLNDFDGKILEDSIENIKSQKNKQDYISDTTIKTPKSIQIADNNPLKHFLMNIVYKVFPSVYKGWMVKKALKKLDNVNIKAEEFIKKQIPYGESDARYKSLIDYLVEANSIQAKLGRKE